MCVVRLDYGNTVVNKGLEDILRDDPNVVCGYSPDDGGTSNILDAPRRPSHFQIIKTESQIPQSEAASTERPSTSCEVEKLVGLTPSSTIVLKELKQGSDTCSDPIQSPETPTARFTESFKQLFRTKPSSDTKRFSIASYPSRIERPRSLTMTAGTLVNTNPRKRMSTESVEEGDGCRWSMPIARHQSESRIYALDDTPLQRSMSGSSSVFQQSICTTSSENQPSTSRGLIQQGERLHGVSALDRLLMTDIEVRQFSRSFSTTETGPSPLKMGFLQFSPSALPIILPPEGSHERPQLHLTPKSPTSIHNPEIIRHQSEPGPSTFVHMVRFPGCAPPVRSPSGDFHAPLRRSEAAKCRRVYGAINKSKWCKQCRWKKACTRFQPPPKDPP